MCLAAYIFMTGLGAIIIKIFNFKSDTIKINQRKLEKNKRIKVE